MQKTGIIIVIVGMATAITTSIIVSIMLLENGRLLAINRDDIHDMMTAKANGSTLMYEHLLTVTDERLDRIEASQALVPYIYSVGLSVGAGLVVGGLVVIRRAQSTQSRL